MRTWFFLGGLLLLGGLLALGQAAPRDAALAPRPASPADCGLAWRLVPSPRPPNTTISALLAVAALSPQDAWAVGSYNLGTHAYALTEHWDGTAWQIVPTPPVEDFAQLYAVLALAADDVWASGRSHSDVDGDHSLFEHWDGTTWQIVPSPNPPSRSVTLTGLAATAPDDIWAAGIYVADVLGSRTLTMHWDGATWQIVPSPNVNLPDAGSGLYGVAAVAPNDAWAVGTWVDAWGGANYTLIEHWDGQSWQIVPSPNIDPSGNDLLAATAGPSGVWAVGDSYSGPMALRWEGLRWQFIPGMQGGNLRGVAAGAADDLWAVGYAVFGGYGPAVSYHWDGTNWARVYPPDPPSGDQYLFDGVAALPDHSAWAVGEHGHNWVYNMLVMQYTDPCLTPSPTPSPTATPPPPSATPTVPSSATPTACALTFSDVPPTQPFYPFIHCLACRGIVSGYADGTFRPGADVTRGQLAKILAGAAAFQDAIPSTQQTFADVPGSAPFWLWAERLAGHGAISGYACGGPGEPCDGQQRPYFRPGAAATRGQIAKIAALAAGIADPVPTAQQTFADVPPGNPFWRWIEQLAGRGVISGYACGGPGEPCLPPGNQPYFRWGANTTRGQTAKIAANTFFPGCQTP